MQVERSSSPSSGTFSARQTHRAWTSSGSSTRSTMWWYCSPVCPGRSAGREERMRGLSSAAADDRLDLTCPDPTRRRRGRARDEGLPACAAVISKDVQGRPGIAQHRARGQHRRSLPVTSHAGRGRRGSGRRASPGQGRRSRDGASLCRLHRMRPLPYRLGSRCARRRHRRCMASAPTAGTRPLKVPARTLVDAADELASRRVRPSRAHRNGLRRTSSAGLTGADTIAVFGQGPSILPAHNWRPRWRARDRSISTLRGWREPPSSVPTSWPIRRRMIRFRRP